jgi:hypothetical protein
MNWTADFVLAVLASGMSLAFAYLPVLKDWYDSLDSRHKPLIMLALITVMVFGHLAVECAFDWACIQAGLPEAGALWLACLVANQQTYQNFVRQVKQSQREVYYDLSDDIDPAG